MEVRKASPDDWVAIQKLFSIVYNQPRSEFSVDEGDPGIGHTWAVFEGAQPVSTVVSHEFAMSYDGAFVPMAGIGGVATLPEHRRRGHVRTLFRAAFDEMRERAQVFSALFPFSFPYYRMFGYELAHTRDAYVLPLDAVDVRSRGGSLQRVEGAIDELRAVYDAFATGRNLAMERTDRMWESRMKADVYRDQVFTYLHRDDAGRPRAYVTFHPERYRDDAYEALVRDIAFDGHDALRGLLAHVAVFPPHTRRARLALPSDVPLHALVPEPYVVEQTRSASMMARVADVPAALEAKRWSGSGELVVRVRDDGMDWNDGIFVVEWDAGQARAGQTTREPQITADVRALSRLLCGYVDAGTAARCGFIESTLEPEELSRLLPAKPRYQNDPF
ncbi:MAG: GNAT family N-acetyltransferase [Spirochaetota bacterium]